MLGKVFQFYQGIAISGTHGKSTTSGWLAYILKLAGLDPNFIVGASISRSWPAIQASAAATWFVAEACEYDRSFLNLKPQIGCHTQYRGRPPRLLQRRSGNRRGVPRFRLGTKTCGRNHRQRRRQKRRQNNLDSRLRENDRKIETFGFGKECNYYADNIDRKRRALLIRRLSQ